MTGPSLAGVWGRRAGSAADFSRYSDALKRSELVWNAQTLDAWLRNPAAVVPGNTMLFDGISQAGTRADLLAYLQAVSEGRVSPPDRRHPNLKLADASRQVAAIRYCGDAYRVVTADGKTSQWACSAGHGSGKKRSYKRRKRLKKGEGTVALYFRTWATGCRRSA